MIGRMTCSSQPCGHQPCARHVHISSWPPDTVRVQDAWDKREAEHQEELDKWEAQQEERDAQWEAYAASEAARAAAKAAEQAQAKTRDEMIERAMQVRLRTPLITSCCTCGRRKVMLHLLLQPG
jgi:hypothetical protein